MNPISIVAGDLRIIIEFDRIKVYRAEVDRWNQLAVFFIND